MTNLEIAQKAMCYGFGRFRTYDADINCYICDYFKKKIPALFKIDFNYLNEVLSNAKITVALNGSWQILIIT